MHKGNSLLEKQLIWAFYLILAVIIYFMLQSVISEKSFFEEYFVREVGLTIDTLYNSPGNVKIEYLYLKDINLKIKENIIEIKYLIKSFPKIYYLTVDKNYNKMKEDLSFSNSTLRINHGKNKINFESIQNE